MKESRQKIIVDILMKEGFVKTSDLVEKFGVSTVTIRRDFNQLEKSGFLKKSYGGAILASNYLRVIELDDWQKRVRSFSDEKRVITQKAAEYIPEGSVIATDVGTTMYAFAKSLSKKGNLTVITNDLYIAQEILSNSSNRVYLAGGLLSQSLQTTGHLSKKFFDNFALIDFFVFSADGITLEDGITCIDAEVNELKKMLIDKATKNILVTDHSKFEKKAIFRTCSFEDIDILITDCTASKNLVKQIKSKGVIVETVPIDSAGTEAS